MRRTAVSCMALLVGAMGCGHSEDEWQQAMHIRRELTADLDAANKAHADREGILRSLTARVETLRRSVSADSQTAPPPASVLASAPTTAPPSIPDVPNPPAPALRPTDADLGGSPQPTAFAVVVGVEKYSAQLPAPIGARADAERFRELAVRSFGIAPNHIQMVLDEQATKGGIERALAWARASTPSGGRIYFYFSGHGAPDTSTGTSATPYIVPYDGDPSFLDATAIPVQEVLTKLSQSSAREVLAFLDSCFSGAGGRSVLPSGERPLVRVKVEQAPAQVALLTAASGTQVSGLAADGSGGLFTKYLIAGLGTAAADLNGDGQVSLGELAQWVAPRVSREARGANRDQVPSLAVGRGLGSPDNFVIEWGLSSK